MSYFVMYLRQYVLFIALLRMFSDVILMGNCKVLSSTLPDNKCATRIW